VPSGPNTVTFEAVQCVIVTRGEVFFLAIPTSDPIWISAGALTDGDVSVI
jgi:hypothetical protein